MLAGLCLSEPSLLILHTERQKFGVLMTGTFHCVESADETSTEKTDGGEAGCLFQ